MQLFSISTNQPLQPQPPSSEPPAAPIRIHQHASAAVTTTRRCCAPACMPRSNVKVVLRTRPCASEQSQSHLQIDAAAKAVTIVSAGRSGLSGLPSSSDKSGGPQRYQFKFDGILHDASQEEVFEVCAADMVQQALDGYNGCIMCYGQTGAGKTFTMSGNTASYEQRGLIPRVLAALLSALRCAPGLASWGLSLSYLEVYNDVLYDLLDINSSPSELTLYEDGAGQLQVSGARKVSVTSEAEALALFFEGETNRVIGQHQLNRESSRSHSVFMAHTTCVHEGGPDGGTATSSKLCLVDLAGSERVAKTRSEGLLLREAGAINKSLALLEQVVLAAAAVGRGAWSHVPYRTCKLTHVLKDCLGGNCATLLVANVWGDATQLDETLSTCRFASRMAALQVDVSRNTLCGSAAGGVGGGRAASARVRALEREVQELKEELAMMELMTSLSAAQQQQQQQQEQQPPLSAEEGQHSAGSNNTSISGAVCAAAADKYAPYSAAQRLRLRQQVVAWLQQEQQQQLVGAEGGLPSPQQQWCGGTLAPLPLHNVRQLRELLFAFKAIVHDVLSSRPASGISTISSSSAAAAAASGGAQWLSGPAWPPPLPPAPPKQLQPAEPESDLVVEGEDGSATSAADLRQHSAIAAPDDARPSSYGALSSSSCLSPSRDGDGGAAAAAIAAAAAASGGAAGPQQASPSSLADREAALLLYRSGPGAAAARVLNDNHSRLKAARRRRQLLAEQLNGLKAELDDLLQQQKELKQQRLQGAQAAAAAAMSSQQQQQQQQEQQVAQTLAAAQVLGPEEYRLTTVIREVKAQYRDAHAELQLVRDEVSYTSGLLDTCRAELVAGFEAWWAAATTAAAAAVSGAVSPSGRLRVSSSSPQTGSPSQQQSWQQQQPRSTPPLASLVGGLGGNSFTGSSYSSGSVLPRFSTGSAASAPGSAKAYSMAGSLSAVSGGAAGGGDAAAAAYYEAQQQAMLLSRAGKGGGGGSAGSSSSNTKKHRRERGTFSQASRASAADTVQYYY